MEKQSIARTGRSAGAAVVTSSCPHLPAVMKTAEYGAESEARDGLVCARCLICGSSWPPREGVDEVSRALAKPSFGDAGQGTERGLSSNAEGEHPSNSSGVKGNFTTIIDETCFENVVERHGEGKPTRGTSRRRRGGSK